MSSTKKCIYCPNTMDARRMYPYCADCSKGILRERRAEFEMHLMPKQGFGVFSADSKFKPGGRSSGRA